MPRDVQHAVARANDADLIDAGAAGGGHPMPAGGVGGGSGAAMTVSAAARISFSTCGDKLARP